MSKISLSVIIVNWNTKELLKNCLESIDYLNSEIIVVDNGSTDGSVEYLKSLKPKAESLKLIFNNKNLGFAKANNQGIKIAKGEYVLLLNSDTVVKKGSLVKMIKFAQKNNNQVIVVPRLLNKDGSFQDSCYHFPTIANVLKGKFKKYAPEKTETVDVAVAAAMLIPKAVLQKIGLLDERYFMYFEDFDYCRRAKQADVKVFYLTDAEIIHLHGASGKKMKETPRKWLVESSKIYHGLFKHHLINLKRPVLWLVFFPAILVRLLLIFISGYHPDILNHVDWGIKLWEYGPKNFYEQIFWGFSWPNQPVGSMLLFGLVAKLYQFIYSFLWWLNLKIGFFPSFIFPFVEQKMQIVLLKAPFILADIGLGYLLFKIAGLAAALLFLFNPALIYNSAVWGQTDSLINLMAFLGTYLVFKRKYFLGFLIFFTGLYFKLSLVIWLPIVFLIVYNHKSFRKAVFPLLFAFGFLLLVSLPFVHHGNVFTWLWYLYTNRILPRQGEMLSGNAFNFWTLIYGIDFSLKENMPFLFTTAKIFGRMVTLILTGAVTLPFLSKGKRNFSNYLFLMIFYSFISFFFLTNMHERYLYPVFVPIAILTALGKIQAKYFYFLSLIYFINLYNLWWYPNAPFLKAFLEFGNSLVPRILSFCLAFIFFRMFFKIKK